MQSLLNGIVVAEVGLLSTLVALGLSRLALNGLFRLMPCANHVRRAGRLESRPVTH
jgi:hypothetical protein